jgi:NAD(P)-dependent dehydrogenase (short-subunit alcohol dehydrogenase family)
LHHYINNPLHGGIGIAIAKRIAADRILILADYSEHSLDSAPELLQRDVHLAQTHKVDVSDLPSVKRVATDAANGQDESRQSCTKPGLSPSIASSRHLSEVQS